MGRKDPRIDAYIEKSAVYARPILRRLRKVVHAACPEVQETLKWSSPSFEHKGLLCGMAAFKNHCTFGFWKHSLVLEGAEEIAKNADAAMGQLGRIASLSDLPDDETLVRLVRKAAELNEKGIKVPRPKPAAVKRELVIPAYFTGALRKNARAKATFDGFSHSNRKEYVEWVTEAKTEETRKRRLETAIAWMAEGRTRNWKYVRK